MSEQEQVTRMNRSEYEANLRSAYAVIAGLQNLREDDECNMRAARRQLELFLDDGTRERITVALVLLDETRSSGGVWGVGCPAVEQSSSAAATTRTCSTAGTPARAAATPTRAD